MNMILTKEEIEQIRFLKCKTPTERFALMLQLIDGQIKAMKSRLIFQSPDFT